MQLTGGNEAACIYTSTAIALATFIIVTFLHLITLIKFSLKNIFKRREQKFNAQFPVVHDNNEEAPQQIKAVQHQVLHFNELREPLLEDCNRHE